MTHSAFRISSAPQGILLMFGTVNVKLDDEGVMVRPPFPFSTHLWPPPTPSASTPLQLQSILAQLMQLCHTHSQTNYRSIPDLFGPGSHTKVHHLYTLSTFVLFA